MIQLNYRRFPVEIRTTVSTLVRMTSLQADLYKTEGNGTWITKYYYSNTQQQCKL